MEMNRKNARRVLGVGLSVGLFLVGIPGRAGSAPVPLEPPSSGGIPAIDRALMRLAAHHRLLMVAAHPDDEDTSLLTWVARARGGEAAYLSLSRGEGGQNLIGEELGSGLGLLRSRELLAARQVDGARQFFSRAFDFGYTRSVSETLDRWPEAVLLEDTVRVIRRFKPHILVAVFPPDARAGHGQHQVSGLVAERAMALAADPTAFPSLLAEGLRPWRVEALYRRARRGEHGGPAVALGEIDPWTGRSVLQIALDSRSRHRCQDMGSLQPLGDSENRLLFVAGQRSDDFFSASAAPLSSMAELLGGALAAEVGDRLRRIETLAIGSRKQLQALDPSRSAPALAEIVTLLEETQGLLAAPSVPGGAADPLRHVSDLLHEKQIIAGEALASAAQVFADAVSEQEALLPGGEIEVRSFFWNAGPYPAEGLEIGPVGDLSWQEIGREPEVESQGRFAARVDAESRIRFRIPAGSAPTEPYFLQRPIKETLYDWSQAPAEVRGEPFGPPPLRLGFRFRILGTEIILHREVVLRARNQARGEIRRPLRVVSPVEIRVDPSLLVMSGESGVAHVDIEVSSNLDRAIDVQVGARTPPGWPSVDRVRAEIAEPRGTARLRLPIVIPANTRDGRYTFSFVVVDDEGNRFDQSLPLIEYEHIRPTQMVRPAELELALGAIEWPDLARVGYVRGASDRVPESLLQVGVPVEILPARELLTGDLSSFAAIVIGSRAFEIEPALGTANGRLLDYARQGGLVIVQYQQYHFASGDFAPYPLAIERPHDRVTDETAPVRILRPEHSVFQQPNTLRATDWEGWVQERGLYFADSWDPSYVPLLAMADPGFEEQMGGLLVAEVGKGNWVYTGLAFFRQLPAGVLGAYRLFANLLGLATARESLSDTVSVPEKRSKIQKLEVRTK